MEKLKFDTVLKKIIAIELILALALSIFLLTDKVNMLNEKEKQTGKYKDILIPIIQYNDGNTFGRSFGSESDQAKNEYKIIRYELYLLNTQTGEVKQIEKLN
jgi:hypothetical protein